MTRAKGNKCHAKTHDDEQESQWDTKINTQNVPLRQNTEEKVRGKGLKVMWGDENEWNEALLAQKDKFWHLRYPSGFLAFVSVTVSGKTRLSAGWQPLCANSYEQHRTASDHRRPSQIHQPAYTTTRQLPKHMHTVTYVPPSHTSTNKP
jgi:hypothetical protein